MDVHLVNHTSLDVLARLETSFLQLRDGFVASLLMLTQYTNIQIICLVLVSSLSPQLVPLSQDLPMILDCTFGGMTTSQAVRSVASDLNLGACLV